MAKERQLAIELLLKDKKALSQLRSALGKIEKRNKKTVNAIIPNWLKVTAAITGVVLVTKKLFNATFNIGKAIIKTTSDFERYRIELQAFTKSAEAAQEKLDELIAFSVRTPFTPEQVIRAGKLLAPLEKLGFKMEELLTASGNAAVTFGLNMEEAALQMVRTFTAGIGAADLFRDRGVRSFIELEHGIDLTTLSMDELRTTMIRALTTGEIGQGIARLSQTFQGLASTLEGEIQDFLRLVGEAGFFDVVKNELQAVLFIIRESKKEGGQYEQVVQKLSDTFVTLFGNAKKAMTTIIVGGGQSIDSMRLLERWVRSIVLQFQGLVILTASAAKLNPLVNVFGSKEQKDTLTEFLKTTKQGLAENIDKIAELGNMPDVSEMVAAQIESFNLMFEKALQTIQETSQEAAIVSQDSVAQAESDNDKLLASFTKLRDGEINKLIQSSKVINKIKTKNTVEGINLRLKELKATEQVADAELTLIKALEESKANIEMESLKLRVQATVSFVTAVGGMFTSLAQLTGSSTLNAVALVTQAIVQSIAAINTAIAAVAAASGNFAKAAAILTAVAALIGITAGTIAQLRQLRSSVGDEASADFAKFTNNLPQLDLEGLQGTSFEGLAAGGRLSTPGGVIVGEKGPELLSLPSAAQVTPLNGGGTVINIEINNPVISSGEIAQEFARMVGQEVSDFLDTERARL